LPGLTIADAKTVAAGSFTPPAPAGGNAPAPTAFTDLPAFCRVVGTLKSGEKTESRVEFWFPQQGWNGDFQPAGSSFWGGSIPYGRMREILKTGAATAASNLGHDGTGPSFAKDDRELLKALGDVPFHDLLDRGKVLINTYYSKGPTFTLMDECGGGGSRDVLAEIQRHPKDLDIGAAIGFTNYGTHHGVAHMWVYNATHKTPASFIPESKYKLIHDAALAACDMKDGVKDGVIEDPPRCGFDPGTLTCKGGDSPTCLTAPQVAAVRTIYQTPVHARTKAVIYGSMPPGTEMGWDEMAGPVPYPYSVTFYKYLVFNDETSDLRNLVMGPVGSPGEAEAIASQHRAVLNDDPVPEDHAFADGDACVNHASASDLRVLADGDVRVDDGACSDARAIANRHERADGRVGRDGGRGGDRGERVNADGRRGARRKELRRPRERHVRM